MKNPETKKEQEALDRLASNLTILFFLYAAFVLSFVGLGISCLIAALK